MPETNWKEVNSNYKVFQSLIPFTFRKKWCISYKTDGWSKASASGWLLQEQFCQQSEKQSQPSELEVVQWIWNPLSPKSSSQCRWKAAPAIHRATPLSKALVIHNASFRAGKLHQCFRDTLQFLKNMFKRIFLEISGTNQKPGTNHVCTNMFRVKHWLLNGINWFWDRDKSLGA